MSDDATINIELAGPERDFLRTGFDLLITSPDGAERRQPVCYAQMSIGGPGDKVNDVILDGLANRQAVLHYRQGQLFFTNQNASCPCTINGEPASFREVSDQDEIRLGGYTVLVSSLMDQLATLEGYTEPNRNRHWPIGNDPCTIGRKGKRENKVELEDPTVSRVQATIRHVDGTFFLESETDSSPTRCSGDKVQMGQPRVLSDGDLIQLGQQLFRFRTAKGASKPRTLAAQEATILFSDIWNYSSLSENRPLEETIMQMNDFYRAMGKVIESERGVLMTFLGDAMMAVFGADGPSEKDPVCAVRAALGMQERLIALNQRWESEGKPTMRIGVGINTGEVMVGDVGFTGKLEFAAMGDNTNLAARLEKLTREFDAGIVVSGSTYNVVKDQFRTVSLGSTRVKGRQAPVDVYQITGSI